MFITVYNLPPWLALKHQYILLPLIILGPTNLGQNLDVFLQPLVHELKMLFIDGIETYDAHRKENFQMRAVLTWLVSDFPAYAMLSGWSTHDIPYLTGDEIWQTVKHFNTVYEGTPYGPNYINPDGFGVTHNWVKRSIFWELPYWRHLLIRHNLDLMHIEKNVFENMFHTSVDTPKYKDKFSTRQDLEMLCDRPLLNPVRDNKGKAWIKKGDYTLETVNIKKVCAWLKKLKFPDGYASNIRNCVNVKMTLTRDSTDGSAKHLEPLENGPSNDARSYNGYFVNGYKFHTQEYGKGRAMNNYGLCVRGEMYNGEESDYYGLLDEIPDIDYYGIGCSAVVLFKCTWFDNIRGVVVIKNKLVDVKPTSDIQTNDPFCLASQAKQVFYTPYPAVINELKDIWAVVKTKPRGVYEVTEAETEVTLDGSTEAMESFILMSGLSYRMKASSLSDPSGLQCILLTGGSVPGASSSPLPDPSGLPYIPLIGGFVPGARSSPFSDPSSFPHIHLTGGFVPGARSSPFPDPSGLQRIPLTGGSVLGARSSPLPDPSGLPCIPLTGASVLGFGSSPLLDASGLPRGGFVSGARSSPDPNGLPCTPLSGGLSRTSVRTERSGFSGSSSMGDINTHMGLTDAVVDIGVTQYQWDPNEEGIIREGFENTPKDRYRGRMRDATEASVNSARKAGHVITEINNNFEILANYNTVEIHIDVGDVCAGQGI
ncbi:unnamed protein product [Lactuca saligna]|uniref:DUF4216 domain-containing protein n=1 Tax=Lactuca saligna TaxID=75948 RepID=A0AA35ZW29_LACSI|nr:unnamed protein product [Lactuca saligna]